MTVKRRACNQERNTNRILILLSHRRRVYNVARRNSRKFNIYLRTKMTFRVNKKGKIKTSPDLPSRILNWVHTTPFRVK